MKAPVRIVLGLVGAALLIALGVVLILHGTAAPAVHGPVYLP